MLTINSIVIVCEKTCRRLFNILKCIKYYYHFKIFFFCRCKAVSASDYIQFSSQMIDGQSPRYCGQMKELYVTSEKNFLRLTFKSNDRLDATGFKANYIFLRDTVMNSMKMPQDAGSGKLLSGKSLSYFEVLKNGN